MTTTHLTLLAGGADADELLDLKRDAARAVAALADALPPNDPMHATARKVALWLRVAALG